MNSNPFIRKDMNGAFQKIQESRLNQQIHDTLPEILDTITDNIIEYIHDEELKKKKRIQRIKDRKVY